MQTTLLESPVVDREELRYQRAAIRECIEYGEHNENIEVDALGRVTCFNCGGQL
jgi:hypothetical protein